MYNINKLISPQVLEKLLNVLPTPKQQSKGRKRCDKKALVLGIVYVLKRDVPWYDCINFGASATSCFRYFKEIQRRGIPKKIFTLISHDKTDIKICSIDSTSITSFRFSCCTGFSGKHKKCATKVSVLADKNGFPADVLFEKGNIPDLDFVTPHMENTRGRAKKILNTDKGYTSLQKRRELRKMGIRVNMEMRKGDYIRKIGPKFKLNEELYHTRFTIERLFGWLKSFKRCRLRQEFTMSSFKAFIYLSLIIILIRG